MLWKWGQSREAEQQKKMYLLIAHGAIEGAVHEHDLEEGLVGYVYVAASHGHQHVTGQGRRQCVLYKLAGEDEPLVGSLVVS